jgi:tRNA U34 5-methylaminomethyl-2-thiouridine-forming methyltransferase MnmC
VADHPQPADPADRAEPADRADRADLEWRGDLPVSTRFSDPYYSPENGAGESRHVFLRGNALPERFRAGFHIAELGFGTGLNLCVALAAWRDAGVGGALRYTAFERFPLSAPDMDRALSHFPEMRRIAEPLLAAWADGLRRLTLPDLELAVIGGDARTALPAWEGTADAWFLDGFAPARNPEMWEDGLLEEVARHTAPGGTFATYSAAGGVRRALGAAGFAVERVRGYGRKRHMSRGVRPV